MTLYQRLDMVTPAAVSREDALYFAGLGNDEAALMTLLEDASEANLITADMVTELRSIIREKMIEPVIEEFIEFELSESLKSAS
ncbi:hypothetical protein [Corynebacterium tapiri]|uniref:Uncharacterized protein n=1 Tax=Corynebacterium tapiri TaxID=1448266 RepID=A0A5C4U532_9CORY|nr:hypothetical protein [Corynebacterium tapiri]TNL98782.1 hypothetical protein FHE74_03955 [Corynebacterium tapiri]